MSISKVFVDLKTISKISKEELNNAPNLSSEDLQKSYVRFTIGNLNICETKMARYETIGAYFAAILIIYPMTTLVSTDFVNDEIRKDHYFEDS